MTDVLRKPRTPWHLWLVGGLLFLWNGLGVWQWLQQVTHDPGYWSSLTEIEANYLKAVPLWTDVAYGVAVWGGLIGAVLLLLHRRAAVLVFVLALIGLIADLTYVHLLSNGREVMGTFGTIFGAVLVLILIGQVVYSDAMRRRGVLH